MVRTTFTVVSKAPAAEGGAIITLKPVSDGNARGAEQIKNIDLGGSADSKQTLEMTVEDPAMAKNFEVGKDVSLDFSPIAA